MFCQGCGTSIDADFRFCGECGTRQETVPVPAVAPEPEPVEPALPMYRPEVPDRDGPSSRSAARTVAGGVGTVARGAGSLFEFVLRWGVTALWGAAAVLLFSQGQILPGLGCVAYVVYLVCGGGWLIW